MPIRMKASELKDVKNLAAKLRGRGRARKTRGEMNGLESWFASELEGQRQRGEILYWAYEPVKFRLADNTYYTPDFLVMDLRSEISFIETKGHWEPAARVRIKVAAEQHPFRFVALTCKCRRKQWSVEKTEEFGA